MSANIDPLIMSKENPLFLKFLKKHPELTEDLYREHEYEWKVFLVKKYFCDKCLLGLYKVLAGSILSPMILPVVSYSKSPIAIYINPHIRSFIFAVVILVGFFYCIGFGLVEIIFYLYFFKHYDDYVWEKQNNVSEQIKRFYS